MRSYTNSLLMLIVVFDTTLCIAQGLPSLTLQWTNMKEEYSTISEIKPSVLNRGDSTVYLFGGYCLPYANILRLNESTKQWELVYQSELLQSRLCDSTFRLNPDSAVSLAIAAMGPLETSGETPAVRLASEKLRPIAGTYILSITYSFTPFGLNSISGKTTTVHSPEFKMR